MCVCLPMSMSVHHVHMVLSEGNKKGIAPDSLETEVAEGCKQPGGCWKQNSDLLQDQQVFQPHELENSCF